MSPELSKPLDVIDVAQGPLSCHAGANPITSSMGLNNIAAAVTKDTST